MDQMTSRVYAGLALEEFDRDGAVAEATEHAGVGTRGDLLRRAGAGGAVLIAGLVAPGRAQARSRARDQAILNYALSLEYLQAAFYTEAERLKSLRGPFARQARVVGAHERAHVAAFRAVLGRHAIKRPRFDFRGVTEDQAAFRQTAVAFEDLAVAAYKGQLPRISARAYLMSAVQIHSVEARHAAWIRRLAGRLPAPDAFDQPLGMPKVGAIVADTKFIVSSPKTSGKRNPKFTG
jgi:Ferritin-like domain